MTCNICEDTGAEEHGLRDDWRYCSCPVGDELREHNEMLDDERAESRYDMEPPEVRL